jgi:hypothetical protein
MQELTRVEDAWQLRWAGETARMERLHGDELTAAAIKHRQARHAVLCTIGRALG